MEQENLFSEQQKFGQVWAWLVVGSTILPIGIGMAVLNSHKPVGLNFGDVFVLAFSGVLIFAIFYFFIATKLLTNITAQGVDVRFAPFHKKAKHFDWTEIEKAYIRKYNSFNEYGGWGIRGFSSNKAYNVSGSNGFQLVLNNGKRLLIGTQKPGDIQKVLDQLNIPQNNPE